MLNKFIYIYSLLFISIGVLFLLKLLSYGTLSLVFFSSSVFLLIYIIKNNKRWVFVLVDSILIAVSLIYLGLYTNERNFKNERIILEISALIYGIITVLLKSNITLIFCLFSIFLYKFYSDQNTFYEFFCVIGLILVVLSHYIYKELLIVSRFTGMIWLCTSMLYFSFSSYKWFLLLLFVSTMSIVNGLKHNDLIYKWIGFIFCILNIYQQFGFENSLYYSVIFLLFGGLLYIVGYFIDKIMQLNFLIKLF